VVLAEALEVVDDIRQPPPQVVDVGEVGDPVLVGPVQRHRHLHLCHVVQRRRCLVVLGHVVFAVVEHLVLAA